MAEMIDHFVDEQGEHIDILVVDHDDYVGLDANRKLLASQQPIVTYLDELPSTQGYTNLVVDVATYLFT